MALISDSIPSFANGVSQQPPPVRLPSQGEAQEDAYSSLVEGLTKRPPTELVAELSSSPLGNVFVHEIDRDPTERYIVVIGNGTLRVWDFNGVEKTVNFPDGTGYLTASNPKQDFAALTVADFTFIVNRSKTVAKTTPGSTAPTIGTVYIKQAAYNTTYRVYINGTQQASHTVPASSGADTETIASALQSALATNLGAGWSVSVYGSVIWIKRNDNAAFTLHTKDSAGDQMMTGFTDKTQRFTDLPPKGFDGVTVEITGDSGNTLDSYYVKYDKATNRWVETVKADHADGLDASTMPFSLVRESNGTFTFKKITWAGREAGDRDSNPDPTFVGRKIKDVFFFRGRLGFLSDENLCLSAVGDDGYFRFYRATVTALLDSDPIDIAAKNTKVSLLNHAIEFDTKLYMFSKNAQFVSDPGEVLSPATATVKKITEFESSELCKPIASGRSVFFAVPQGKFTGIREFYVPENNEKEDAADVTAPVPHYLAANVFKLVSSTNHDILFAVSQDAPNVLYVYKFFWQDTDKVQSSWSRWHLPCNSVLGAVMIGSAVYVVLERDEGVTLEKIDISEGRTDTGLPFLVRLDRRMVLTGTYDPVNQWTTWTLPTAIPTDADLRVILGPDFGGSAGSRLQSTTRPSTTTIRRSGDWSAGVCYIGVPYTYSYTLSPVQVRKSSASGKSETVQGGRLQVLTMTLVFANTGYFKVTVKPKVSGPYEYIYSGRVVGDSGNVVGSTAINSGEFRFPVMAENNNVEITIESDSHLPVSLLSCEWEGRFNMRSRRL